MLQRRNLCLCIYLFLYNEIRLRREVAVAAGPGTVADEGAASLVSTIVTGFIGEVAAAVEIMEWRFVRQAMLRKGWDLARVCLC